jgi:hypothetical protein
MDLAITQLPFIVIVMGLVCLVWIRNNCLPHIGVEKVDAGRVELVVNIGLDMGSQN